MSQHDYVIDNATAAAVRTDLNNALKAIRTSNSGSTEPSTTFQNQWWFDTATNNLKFRNDANSAWVTIGKVDQSDSEWKPHIGGTRVTDFFDENDMASDSDSAVASQQSIKAYVDASTSQQLGVGQTWQAVTRTSGTSYQNTTGRPIVISFRATTSGTVKLEVSQDDVSWLTIQLNDASSGTRDTIQGIIPNNHYYRATGIYDTLVELR